MYIRRHAPDCLVLLSLLLEATLRTRFYDADQTFMAFGAGCGFALAALGGCGWSTARSQPYVVRDFNIVLTDNTKVSDLACCMGLSGEIKSAPEYQCFDHQDLQMGTAPGSRRVGIQFCHHLPGSDPQAATDAFNNVCKQGTGEVIQTDKNYCPQIWPNFKDDYKKPAPPCSCRRSQACPRSYHPGCHGQVDQRQGRIQAGGHFHVLARRLLHHAQFGML